MKYKLYYNNTPTQLLLDPDRGNLCIYYTFDKDLHMYAPISEQQAIILKLKYPNVKLSELNEA